MRHTSSGKLIELPGLDIPQAVQVILSVMPLDDFIPEPVSCMQVVGAPEKILPMQAEVHAIARASEGREVGMERLERFAFYEAANRIRRCAYVRIQALWLLPADHGRDLRPTAVTPASSFPVGCPLHRRAAGPVARHMILA